MRILKRKDILSLITMKEVIEIIRNVFIAVGKNQVVLPERTVVEMKDGKNAVLFMPGYMPTINGIGIKIVSVFPDNISKGIPTINAQVLLNNPETGEIMCMMEGGLITAMRTAAVSAVATDILALEDAHTLGIFGAGVQSKSQIEAIMEVRPITNVKIFDVDINAATNLAETMKSLKGEACEFEASTTPDEVVNDSKIIVTATTSTTPVFDGSLLTGGTHINAIGSFKPHIREVDDTTMQRASLFVDALEHALAEAGDLIIPMNTGIITKTDIKADLGELVLNKKSGRGKKEEITFFKSVGMAVQDIAVADAIIKKAEEQNVGVVL